MGEDHQEEETKIVEGFEEEEAKEAPTPIDKKKRKAKEHTMTRLEKVVEPSHTKPTTPTTRASGHVIAQKAKEKEKPIEQEGGAQKRPRRKHIAQVESDEEGG